MVGVAGLDILLPAVEDWLARQKLREYAPDRPNVDGLSERIHMVINLFITYLTELGSESKNRKLYTFANVCGYGYGCDPEMNWVSGSQQNSIGQCVQILTQRLSGFEYQNGH
jgi:hypothetical protein